jgi:GMP synthase-like glutamine amidotransferase
VPTMRCRVIANREDCDSGFVGMRLVEQGFELDLCVRESPREWSRVEKCDLILTLGSDWSVYWKSVSREVQAELDLLVTAASRGVPIFAICFGAQVVAHAFGGTVLPASRLEIGWHQVFSSEYPHELQREWFQWHGDEFTAPRNFKVIAQNQNCNQAVLGPRVFACQFHPEATPAMIARWMALGAADIARTNLKPHQLFETVVARASATETSAARLVDWFLNHSNST